MRRKQKEEVQKRNIPVIYRENVGLGKELKSRK
jgi:hypothetical protein